MDRTFRLDSTMHSDYPFAQVADSIRQLGFRDGIILAETPVLAGSLRLHFPSVARLPTHQASITGMWN